MEYSPIGLPVSLKYDLPPSVSDSCRSYSVNVNPNGITTLTGPALPATCFVANSTANFGSFTQQVIGFDIPCGNSDSVFLDPHSTTLSFTLTYPCTVASVGGTGTTLNLVGSGASFFDQLTLYSNNVPLETINNYGLLQNFLLNNTVSKSERAGGISVCMGTDDNSNNGVDLPFATVATAASPIRLNFSIPLLSFIGINCPDKLFPIGSVNNLQLQLQTAMNYPLVSYCTVVPTTMPSIGGFTLSEFSLNLKYLDIGDVASQMMRQTLQNGKWFIKASTYTNSNITIPAQSSGSQQLLMQIRNTSVKSIFHTFGTAVSSSCPNGLYDSINPSLSSRQLQIGGSFFPNKPINDIQRSSEGYVNLLQSLGGNIGNKASGTSVSRSNYNACIPSVPAGSELFCVFPNNGVRPVPAGGDTIEVNIAKNPNMFYCGYDLEKSNGVLFQGYNTRSTPPFLNLFLAQSTGVGNNITCTAWGLSDAVIVFDVASKSVQAMI